MPKPTKPEGLFITGTGYFQGSTMITAALARYCSDRDLKTAVFTPAETGCAKRVPRRHCLSGRPDRIKLTSRSVRIAWTLTWTLLPLRPMRE